MGNKRSALISSPKSKIESTSRLLTPFSTNLSQKSQVNIRFLIVQIIDWFTQCNIIPSPPIFVQQRIWRVNIHYAYIHLFLTKQGFSNSWFIVVVPALAFIRWSTRNPNCNFDDSIIFGFLVIWGKPESDPYSISLGNVSWLFGYDVRITGILWSLRYLEFKALWTPGGLIKSVDS